MNAPLGIRDLNPGNLQWEHVKWLGMLPPDGAELVFDTLADGIRAFVRVCYAYQLHGWNTPQLFVTHFSPSSAGNPTAQYCTNVCDWCGFTPDQTLDFHDAPTMVSWAHAVFRQEDGANSITDAQIYTGIALAEPT